jgi:hypothetical protein
MPITIANLRYADAANKTVDVDVGGVIDGQTIPFTYHSDDAAPVAQAIKMLLDAGGYTIAPFAPVPVIPSSVSPRQIRLALTQVGLRAQVEAFVASSDQTTKDSWDYATEFLISDPLVDGCMTALGKAEADKVALFQLAATL